MTRWSLSNYFRKTSHGQFTQLATEFKAACENAFSTECALDIRLLSRPKVFTTFMLDDDAMDFLAKENKNAEIIRTNALTDITKEQWEAARYAEINVSPADRSQAPENAFGHAEFKGILSKTATFYMQGGDKTEKAAAQMADNHKWMLVGDGFDSNGRQSAMGLISVAASMGLPSRITAGILTKGRKKFDI